MTRLAFCAVLLLAATHAAAADARLKNVPEYCTVVEQYIVALANTVASSNADLSKFAADKPTADATKFEKARDLLASVSQSLKESETEWDRLGCANILYSSSNR